MEKEEADKEAEAEAEEEGVRVLEDYFSSSPSKGPAGARRRSGSASWFPPPLLGVSQQTGRGRRRRRLPFPRLRPAEKSFTLSPPSVDAAEEGEEEEEENEKRQPQPCSSTSSYRLLRLLQLSAAAASGFDTFDLVPAWIEAVHRSGNGSGGGGGLGGSSGGGAMAAAVAAAVVPEAVRRRRAGRGSYRLWFAVCLDGRLCRLRGRKAILAALRPVVVGGGGGGGGGDGNGSEQEPRSSSSSSSSSKMNPRLSEREQQRRQLCALVAEACRRARAGDARAADALVALWGDPTAVDSSFLAGEMLRPPPSPLASPSASSSVRSAGKETWEEEDEEQEASSTTATLPPSSPLSATAGLIARTFSTPALLLPTSGKARRALPPPTAPPPLLQGPVARCLGDNHWAEERLVLTRVALSFYPVSSSGSTAADASPRLTVAVRDVMGALIVPPEEAPPLPGFAYVEVATLGRVHMVMLKTEAEAAGWVAAIEQAAAAAHRNADGNDDGVGVVEEEDEEEAVAAFMSGYAVSAAATLLAGGGSSVAESFVAAPSHWALGDRMVLTARRPLLAPAARRHVREQDPCAVVARLLGFGFTLDASSGPEEIAIFLDGAAALKHLDPARLRGADEEEGERRKKVKKRTRKRGMYVHGILGNRPNS